MPGRGESTCAPRPAPPSFSAGAHHGDPTGPRQALPRGSGFLERSARCAHMVSTGLSRPDAAIGSGKVRSLRGGPQNDARDDVFEPVAARFRGGRARARPARQGGGRRLSALQHRASAEDGEVRRDTIRIVLWPSRALPATSSRSSVEENELRSAAGKRRKRTVPTSIAVSRRATSSGPSCWRRASRCSAPASGMGFCQSSSPGRSPSGWRGGSKSTDAVETGPGVRSYRDMDNRKHTKQVMPLRPISPFSAAARSPMCARSSRRRPRTSSLDCRR